MRAQSGTTRQQRVDEIGFFVLRLDDVILAAPHPRADAAQCRPSAQTVHRADRMVGELHRRVVELGDARGSIRFLRQLQNVDRIALGRQTHQQIAQESFAAAGGEDGGVGQDEKAQYILTHGINACRWPSP